ncbi:MAG: PIG-L family deacetylase [Flavobacteriales bacterium]
MKKTIYSLCFAMLLGHVLNAQTPKITSSVEIHNNIKKLNFLGSVLYLAAHPDDENTRLISYFSNEVHARTGYLSLTRGDGGQNLIGSELRENLGVLRTQELLGARRVDGGEQFFSRANDFGYSKHPDETLNIWEKDKVLHDVVWTIRKFRPDVIVNRFDHRSPGTTHGHHTTSAMLAMEAFDIADDKKTFENQLDLVQPWQPQRIFFNTSWWFYGSKEKFEQADKSNMTSVDVGVYYPELGLSNNEIASRSRSQHKCQGFGTLNVRGSQLEYLELLKGDKVKNNNVFEGINTTWTRLKGGKQILDILNKVEREFNFQNPEIHLPELVKAYNLISELKDEHWKTLKLQEITNIIEQCLGLYIDPVSKIETTNRGENVQLNVELTKRSNVEVVLNHFTYGKEVFKQSLELVANKKEVISQDVFIAKNANTNSPYWLNQKATLGMYSVEDIQLIGLPETPNEHKIKFQFEVNGTQIEIIKPIVYKYANPAVGEIYTPFQVLPIVSSAIEEDVYIFGSSESKDIQVKVSAWKNNLQGMVSLNVPEGWSVKPLMQKTEIEHKGEEKSYTFTITPSQQQSEGDITAQVEINGKVYKDKLEEINYDHIPKQIVLTPNKAKVVKLDIKKKGQYVAYVKGSGDVIPESLEHIGFSVEILNVEDLETERLKKFDAVVIGIRAYNVLENLDFKQDILFNFVKEGGNMIVQYNTNHRLKTKRIAPYPLTLSRDRVTDEHAEITILEPNHPVLNTPNKITKSDFDGWVQERGLYFPNEWNEAFTPIFSMHDKGETAKKGSLLIAKYGKGNYIYTGLSFFREFPVGVPGAYRLFANIISLD